MTLINIGIDANDIQYPDIEDRIEADVAYLVAGRGNSLSNDIIAVLLARMGGGSVQFDRFTRAAVGLDVDGESLLADLIGIMQANQVVHTHNEDGSPTPEAIEYRRLTCLTMSIAALIATLVPGIDNA